MSEKDFLEPLRGKDWYKAEQEFTHDFLRMETLPQMFEKSADKHENEPAQSYKGGVYNRTLHPEIVTPAPDGEFEELTYGEMRQIIRYLAAGLRDLGVEEKDRVGIFSNTRMEWAHSDFAILATGGSVVTVYTESSPRQVQYLLSDPEAKGVIAENEELIKKVLEVKDELENLEFIISMDEISEEMAEKDNVYRLDEIYNRGKEVFDLEEYKKWVNDKDPEDLATLVYTSGTTGRPKGVKLTHKNIRANANQVFRRFGPRTDRSEDLPVIEEGSKNLSFLPLAHIFARTLDHFLMFGVGANVAYAEKPDTLAEDAGKVHPQVTASVPRVYERIFEAMKSQATESSIKKRIFNWAVGVGKEFAKSESPGFFLRLKHKLADRLVFSTVKERMGGNYEIMASGGGSLSADLCYLFHGMGLNIYEGYGLTETSPVVTTNPAEDTRVGTIGPPLVDVEIKLDKSKAVEEGKEGERGELMVRGPNVSEGYWKKPEKTEKSFTEDGWFRTGDIVELVDGYIKFVDRTKHILVLSTGKNVAPIPIEDEFSTSDIVDQCMVIGDDWKFVSALIVPNFDTIKEIAEKAGVDLPTEKEKIVENEWARDIVWEEVEKINKELDKHEKIKKIELVPLKFTPDNDLLTPSMKKKRRNILSEFSEKVETIYSEEE